MEYHFKITSIEETSDVIAIKISLETRACLLEKQLTSIKSLFNIFLTDQKDFFKKEEIFFDKIKNSAESLVDSIYQKYKVRCDVLFEKVFRDKKNIGLYRTHLKIFYKNP